MNPKKVKLPLPYDPTVVLSVRAPTYFVMPVPPAAILS
jgi:hypothetical protein